MFYYLFYEFKMSLIEEYNQQINSEGERRNSFYLGLLDDWSIETHDNEQK